MKTIPSGIF